MIDAETLPLKDDDDMHPVDAPWEELRRLDRAAAVRKAAAEIGKQMGGGDV